MSVIQWKLFPDDIEKIPSTRAYIKRGLFILLKIALKKRGLSENVL